MTELQKILDDIKAEAEAATGEPWKIHKDIDNELTVFVCNTYIAETKRTNLLNNQQRLNAIFIAHSRTNVPCLCKALEEAIATLQSQGDHISVSECCKSARIVIARITAILKGEKHE